MALQACAPYVVWRYMNMNKPLGDNQALAILLAQVRSHKFMTSCIILLAIILAALGAYQYHVYTQKFSKADYDQLTSMAETVLRNTGGKDIQVSRTCSYERPYEFASLHLYCRVELVTYIDYISSEHALNVSRSFTTAISKEFGEINLLGDSSAFDQKPSEGYSDITVKLSSLHEGHQCNFQIASNRFASRLAPFLPAQKKEGLVGLYFECSAESRAEYFPVTYRQG